MGLKDYLLEGKKKVVFDKKKSDQKKAFRIPHAPATKTMKDKKRYSRKEKHKKTYQKYM